MPAHEPKDTRIKLSTAALFSTVNQLETTQAPLSGALLKKLGSMHTGITTHPQKRTRQAFVYRGGVK